MNDRVHRNVHRLRIWHQQIDRDAGRRARALGPAWRCKRGCSACCRDGLRIFSVEALRICADFGEQLASWKPHPPGKCAMLDDAGACRIYSARPYVCRTQGLPLSWIDSGPSGTVEWRDICPINEPGLNLEALPTEALWQIGPAEGKLAVIERCWDPSMERLGLRALFDPRLRKRLLSGAEMKEGDGEREASQ